MLKTNFTALLLSLLLLLSSSLFAQDKGFGIGFMVGEPTGISGKYWLHNNNALDFGLAYSLLSGNKRFSFHTDYIHHDPYLLNTDLPLEIYYGVGVRFRFKSDDQGTFGIRGVGGILWIDQKLPLDLFFEVAPVFRLFPSTGLNFDIALGGRWYFPS